MFANPMLIKDPTDVAAKLAPLLGRDQSELLPLLSDDDKGFVYLRRKLDPTLGDKIAKLRIEGIDTVSEPNRTYPAGRAGRAAAGLGRESTATACPASSSSSSRACTGKTASAGWSRTPPARYRAVFQIIDDGKPASEIADELIKRDGYSYLQPSEQPYEGVSPTRYSTQVKSGLIMRQLLEGAPRCAICGGLVPMQAVSIDHKTRMVDGGQSTVDNAQLTYPYCNTGYKEAGASRVAKHVKA